MLDNKRKYKLYFSIFEYFSKLRKYLGVLGVFVKQIAILNVEFGLCVFDSIWEHRLKIFVDRNNRKGSTPPPKQKKNAEVPTTNRNIPVRK